MNSPKLESYLQQVEKYLPPWKSGEILREIRSHAMDQAEELAAERGIPVDEALMGEVVAKFGPAQELAAGYTPPVTLIRPEYTMPFAIYSLIAVALLFPFTIFGGLAVWISSCLLAIGLMFVGFIVMSRFSKVYHLPLWHHAMPRVIAKFNVGRGMQKGFEAVWPMTAQAAAGAEDMAMSMTSSESFGGGSATAPPSYGSAPSTPPEKRRTLMEWIISKSGPRPLRVGELVGAGMRVVFGLAIGLYLAFAASPLPLVNVLFEHPRQGWHLLVQGPGIDALRELGVFACFATMAAGLIPIFLGKCRASIYASILSKMAWAVFLFFLAMGGPALSFDFQTTGWTERDWPEVKAALMTATPIFFFVLFGITLLTLVSRFVKLGLMEAWYRERATAKAGKSPQG